MIKFYYFLPQRMINLYSFKSSIKKKNLHLSCYLVSLLQSLTRARLPLKCRKQLKRKKDFILKIKINDMKETGISYTILFLSMSKELNEKVVPLHPIIFP